MVVSQSIFSVILSFNAITEENTTHDADHMRILFYRNIGKDFLRRAYNVKTGYNEGFKYN
jgi:hypothetical protein